MPKINFGAGIVKDITTATTSERDINVEEAVEIVKVSFTIIEAVKILIVSIRNLFKPKAEL